MSRFKLQCAQRGWDLLISSGELVIFLHLLSSSDLFLNMTESARNVLSSTIRSNSSSPIEYFEQPSWRERSDEEEGEDVLMEELAGYLVEVSRMNQENSQEERKEGSTLEKEDHHQPTKKEITLEETQDRFERNLGLFDCNIMEVWCELKGEENEEFDHEECGEGECDENQVFCGSALLSLICSLNHSCDPNSIVRWEFDEGGLRARLVALRTIRQEEELTVSYLDLWLDQDIEQQQQQQEEKQEEDMMSFEELVLPLEIRRDMLLAERKFFCNCNLCRKQQEHGNT